MADTGINAYVSLGADINKSKMGATDEVREGVVSQKLPELALTMEDADLVKLTTQWEKDWKESPKKSEWEKQCEENEKYWLGQQFDSPKADKSRPMVDNLIFESVETSLPQITRRNPEPLVQLYSREDHNEVNIRYVTKVKDKLEALADENKLRLKLKKGARHWSIYQIGVAKFGWDLDKDIPIVRIIRPKRVILDPSATIDEDGYTGNRIGEYRKLEASRILAIAGESITPDAKKAIDDLVGDNTATEIQFIEWWTTQYMCWKLGSHILLKRKNPHWNYDKQTVDLYVGNVDTYGNETPSQNMQEGINHFKSPKMPYAFLSVFNLGDQPMDKTGLIQQNLANQDLINKRNRQIDKNADKMNGGAVVSLARSGLTQPQAKNVVEAVRKGGAVLIPDGNPQEAVYFPQVPSLPADVYTQLTDTRTRMRDIFGIRGSSAAGLENEQTVRGKFLNRTTDTDRNGGISEYLEQFADETYNWFVQLLYVYDTGFQFLGNGTPPRIRVSVKEGSLLPKDSASIAAQAMELASLNRISNIDLFKKLDYPNPEEMAANIWLETNAPELVFGSDPRVMQAIQLRQQAMQEQSQVETERKEQEYMMEGEKMAMKGEMDMKKEAMKSRGKVAEMAAKNAMSPMGGM